MLKNAYMTKKEANSVNPFDISRKIKIWDLITLFTDIDSYEAILISYADPEGSKLYIPTKMG